LPETWNKEACSESAWPLVRERGRVMGLCHAPAGSGWINLLLCLNDANLPHEKSPGRAPRFGWRHEPCSSGRCNSLLWLGFPLLAAPPRRPRIWTPRREYRW